MKHTKRICLLLAVLFMLSAVFGACEPREGDAPGTGSDEVTGGGDKETPDPNADYTVYHARYFAGDCVYYSNYAPLTGQQNLVFTLFKYPGETYHACQIPTCYHNTASDCPLVNMTPFCVVQREGELPLVYMHVRDGEAVYVFDSNTGGTKRVGMLGFRAVSDAWFYRDKLYMSSHYNVIPGRPVWGIGSLDPATKDFEHLDIDVKASMLGIYNDRVWYITDRNMICSCALDFSDQREEYNIGIDETPGDPDIDYTLSGYIDGGMIYFERNCRDPKKFDGNAYVNDKLAKISDVYMLDADNIDAGERLAAEGVIGFEVHNGDLFYTKYDYDNYEESETYTYTEHKGSGYESQADGKTYRYDGGTLYRYEHESGKTVTICEDCGTNFGSGAGFNIIDITDEYVLFGGRQYRDIDDELKDRNCLNNICMLDIKTGEWRVIVPSTSRPLNEVI